MTTYIKQKLNDSPVARWSVLVFLSFTMFCAYYINDVMAPLMGELGKQFNWSATDFGMFNFSYMWINVFLFMLIIGGIILDKIGVRIVGLVSCLAIAIGCGIQYYAVANAELFIGSETFGMKTQLFVACIGFSIFAMGLEMAGITVTKAIARWFQGHEIALAMGLQVAIARLGMALALSTTLPLYNYFDQDISKPILFGLMGLVIGVITFFIFCLMDKKLDASLPPVKENEESAFKIKDLFSILSNKGFWLLALLCVLFYSAVFPFMKYATALMINKYGVEENLAGLIPSILPYGTIILTPLFGRIYDKIGKGVTIMIIGAALLIFVHLLFASPFLNVWWFAAFLMFVLGVAFALVPSAMWPSVPKIIPQNQLGTAYGVIFWVQNIGLGGVPLLIGWVLNKYCIIKTKIVEGKEQILYDFELPMLIFALCGVFALFVAFLLKREDAKKGYGLENKIK